MLQGEWWHREACGWEPECLQWGLGVLEQGLRCQEVQLEALVLAGILQHVLDEPDAGPSSNQLAALLH